MLVPRVVRCNHNVVCCALPQEHEPRPLIEVAVRVEPHLGEIDILSLIPIKDRLQPFTLQDHFAWASRVQAMGEDRVYHAVHGFLLTPVVRVVVPSKIWTFICEFLFAQEVSFLFFLIYLLSLSLSSPLTSQIEGYIKRI